MRSIRGQDATRRNARGVPEPTRANGNGESMSHPFQETRTDHAYQGYAGPDRDRRLFQISRSTFQQGNHCRQE